MKLYHGSPKKLSVIKPHPARGLNKFENQKAVFLCKTFNHAAMYAISKSLKGKTIFAVNNKNIIIVGKNKPKIGYVYEVEVKNYLKGKMGQYISKNTLNPIKTTKVKPSEYKKKIIYVKDKKELISKLK